MVTQDKRREYISICLAGAENWHCKGNLVREANSLSSALMDYLAIAVMEPGGFDDSRLVGLKDDFLAVMSRYDDVVHKLLTGVDAGEYSASSVSATYSHLVLVHTAWALDQLDLDRCFARLANHTESLKLGTPFWREYTAAINQLIDGQAYSAPDIKLKGYERYWYHYLRLIEATTHGQDVAQALTDIDGAFAKRNTDKRLKNDSYEIEGSAFHPVKWDFRKAGLVSFIQKKKSPD